MKSTIVLFAIMAIFACMVAAGPDKNPASAYNIAQAAKKKGTATVSCVHGKKRKNGKCKRATLRVRSADSEDFFEIPDVEDVHWGEIEEDNAEI